MLTKSLFEHVTVPTDEQQCQGLRAKVNEEVPSPTKGIGLGTGFIMRQAWGRLMKIVS